MTGSASHAVVTDDGLTLHVATYGDADATPVVLVHGWPDSGAVWRHVAERLADDCFVVVPDVRGAGASETPADTAGYRLEHLAADVRAVVDAVVGPDASVHLVGHDWGSIQCWEAVTTDALAGRIRSYTSISGPSLDHIGHWTRSPQASGATRRRVLRQGSKSWYVAAFHLPGAPGVWRRVLSRLWPRYLRQVEGVPAEHLDHLSSAALDGAHGMHLYRANIRPRMRQPQPRTTEVPVQLVVAAHDRHVSAAMADAALPHATTVVRREVPAGHWGLLLTDPDLGAQLLSEFHRAVDDGEVPKGHTDMTPITAAGEFTDRLVVVTGAGSGIGRETALAFAARGATVVVADISATAAERTVALIDAVGSTGVAVTVDVADAEAMEVFAKEVLATHGTPDVVVNNAGIGMAGPILDTTTADWERILGVNVWGVIHGCRLFGAAMVERGTGGHIVNVASAAAFVPSKNLGAYATTKAAVLMMSQCLRAELADSGIGVSAICPGVVNTNITSTTHFVGTERDDEAAKQAKTSALYARRNYTPDRVADAIVDAVIHDRDVVPVAPESHVLRAIGRFAPAVAARLARRDLP